MNNGKKIAEGGALLALYSILLFITMQIPVLGLVSFFCLPIPFILTAAKQKLGWSIGFLFVACVLSVLFGTILAIPTALIAGLLGIIIGDLLKRNKPPFIIYISAFLTFLAGTLVMYAISIWFLEINYLQELMKVFEATVNRTIDTMTAFGLEPSEAEQKRLFDMVDMFDTLLPTLLVTTSMVIVALVFVAARPILKRFSEKQLSWPPLRELQLPKSLLWYYLITMILMLFLNQEESGSLYMVLVNLYVILQLLMMLQGYSLLFFFSHLQGWVKAIPVTILVLSLVLPLFQTFIRILGIIDLGFPLREILQKKKE
ncbi:YybS family protein [Bacillus sp. V59.32b]|uniref:YybS family protein n=1 Tax=Bacillus sp. V59.32b TaxID=1758642 RepID=UPI000E3DC365|nr:YybS family protein [Bacillus sp. V59.32b]RFU68072.1 DUF2232 domain-containing protein [Bacillus sp. V59.32b]